ncbi:MAG: thiamine pyrophosphate-dependent dehydrogenase E1 component subunit alpha [Caldilineaceae bacterium]
MTSHPSGPFAGLDPAQLEAMLHQMLLIRAFEETAEELYFQGMIHGTMHLSIGQEGSAVGSIAALRRDDYILSTHRGHGHCIAKGAQVGGMMAEFMGKETGYCRGRGGSMHMADVATGNLGANGIVAGGVPMAAGVGLSIQMQRQDKVILVFFGDGAANEGAFHESLNLASIWNLPVIYLCENNQYAMSMSVARSMNVDDVSARAAAYNIPGVTVDGNDTIAVYAATLAAAAARADGRQPLIEAKTYRYKGHSRATSSATSTRKRGAEVAGEGPHRPLEPADDRCRPADRRRPHRA